MREMFDDRGHSRYDPIPPPLRGKLFPAVRTAVLYHPSASEDSGRPAGQDIVDIPRKPSNHAPLYTIKRILGV